MRVPLESPFCRVWYLRERFTRQTLGHVDPRISSPLPSLMRAIDDITSEALIDDMMLGQHADAFYIPGNYTAFLRSHIMPPLTEGVARAIGVANAHATGDDALAGAAPAARGLAPPTSDVALSLGHPTLSTAVTFQTLNGVLDELPLEPLGRRSLVLTLETQPYPEMGYTNQCLELIDTLMVMVRRREASLIFVGIEIPLPPAMGRKGWRAPALKRGGRVE